MFILQTNIIVIGYDSDDSFRPGVNEITDCGSNESWNRNNFWFMLVASESESFGIVRSGILNRDGA